MSIAFVTLCIMRVLSNNCFVYYSCYLVISDTLENTNYRVQKGHREMYLVKTWLILLTTNAKPTKEQGKTITLEQY